MMSSSFIFNTRFLSELTPDRLYRVYCVQRMLYMIRIAGQGLGPQHLGAVIKFLLRKLIADAKTPEQVAEMDRRDPADLLHEHKHNFSFSALEVRSAVLGPPTRSKSHGAHFGTWKLELIDGRKCRLQFEELEHMHAAVRHLPGILRPRLVVDVRWNAAARRYEKTA